MDQNRLGGLTAMSTEWSPNNIYTRKSSLNKAGS